MRLFGQKLSIAATVGLAIIAINILGGIGGLVIGIAAVLNLNAVGTAALSR